MNYNGWNIPFASNVTIEDPLGDTVISDRDYLLIPCPQAFFSVLFVDSSVYKPENPVTLNYTWFGANNYTVEGEWRELNVGMYITDNNGKLTEVQMELEFFVSYQASPETGLDGFIGMVLSKHNYKMNFMRRLADSTSRISLTN